jgi:hypothetical protein
MTLTVFLTVLLAAGIVVSIINLATILSGNGWRRPRRMRPEPASTLVRTPESVVAVARARASAAATAQRVPSAPREPIALPPGPARTSVRAPLTQSGSVTIEQVRYLVDDLVANNPNQLAQIITDWINEVPDTSSFGYERRRRGTDL